MNPGRFVRHAALIGGVIALAVLPPATLWTSAPKLSAAPSPRSSRGAPQADFNGDGFADLAIGVPGEDVGGIRDPGAVQVLYGTSGGLTAANNRFWTQDSPGMKDAAEEFEHFGFALAAGDFNGDGFADLAIGVPEEDVGSLDVAGAVQVLYGTSGGLTATDNQFWTQDSSGMEDTAEPGDTFGAALSAGDFNADGFADLAIGVQSEDVGSVLDAGAVQVLYGASAGLTAAGDQFWTQDSPGMQDKVESYDQFGTALTAADFNADGFADLAIGVPGEDVGAITSAGSVQVLYGSSAGLSAANDQIWTQDSPGMEDTAELFDIFGFPLSAGDFNGDGYADLAVGVAWEDPGPIQDAGAVQTIYGSSAGLTATNNQFWTQDSPDIEDSSEVDDNFGRALAAGDFNSDGLDDLSVGVYGEDLGVKPDGGAVNVLYGSATGLSAANDQFWNQDSPGIRGTVGRYEHFGYALAAADFSGEGMADLAIGVPWESVQSARAAGAVGVLYGSAAGLDAANNQVWTQYPPSVKDEAETDDFFGGSLASQ